MKRSRDDEGEVEEALHQLQGTLERGFEHKLRALDKVISLIDPSDDQYVIQRALVNGDAAFYVTELLADATAGAKAAEAVAAVCRHAAPSMARLATGPLVGLDSSVERVSLNPCQSDFVDSGAVAALVPMALQRSEAAREAAAEALAALCSFNQEGKLAYLEGLVQALTQQQQLEVRPTGGCSRRELPLVFAPVGAATLELLDALIDGMECGGEAAAQQLDLLLVPLLAELRAGRGRPASQAAVSLLGTLCERRPELAAELRAAGAVAGVAQHLLHGSQEVQDVAARALWLLAKDDKKCLAAEQGLLGCEASALARMLVQLIEVADAEEARQREEEDGGAGSGAEGDAPGGAAGVVGGPPAADICHAEEASALLKALAAAHPEVEQLVEEREVPIARHSSQKCCIQ
ncbi:hypothetical protein CHLNCDRAFT_145475 [Chlorella variabilis]|uniref:Nucleotide exchange factor Fes1 domain-containing protein n=1 Tax=Chlorella variabilis TaxID=554065 RepID=E1ZDK1_CHLVA|nr:hypothetical protein CHLNCDRAFT_145475 [Chlorella variabilis]EFN56036.1 hypothetical protein CHLNCDRAFT_145475 [Chlorella variabilis]|eukprot:XP_005848138.1 hypothetical protein CHLNCDRAFT_145475 [Chlorella variabilis]